MSYRPKQYNFNLTLQHKLGAKIQIDTESLYGYFEYPDGTEGGGLWFSKFQDRLDLIDYDGVVELGTTFLNMLNTAGILVEEVFYPIPARRAAIFADMTIENKTV